MSQQLKGLITKEGRVFGNTNTGVDWCVKALHPSDPMTEVRGIPDKSAIPTLCMNYQTTATLTVRPNGPTPWAFDMTLLPHPLFFAYWDGIDAYDPSLGIGGEGNFRNSQLAPAGTLVDQLVTTWMTLAKRWRLCYQSVTVLQDGPDLANQGTLAVCQSTFEPRILHTGRSGALPVDPYYGTYALAYFDQTSEGPNFERSQAMPNAMIGRSKEGAYIPLKLTDTCQEWQSERDFIIPCNKGTNRPSASGVYTLQTTFTPAYPFPQVNPFHGTYANMEGEGIPGLMNGNVAHLSARNLSNQTSFTFHFRMGIEIQLDPSSTLTPQLKLSPPYDPLAIDTYFAIARELKDGYPADYNTTNKLWEAIKAAISMIAPPLLAAIPGGVALLPYVGPALEGVSAMGRAARARRKAKGKRRILPGRQSLVEWQGVPESDAQRVLREAAQVRLSKELSQAGLERAREQRPPNSARPVANPLPRRPRRARQLAV